MKGSWAVAARRADGRVPWTTTSRSGCRPPAGLVAAAARSCESWSVTDRPSRLKSPTVPLINDDPRPIVECLFGEGVEQWQEQDTRHQPGADESGDTLPRIADTARRRATLDACWHGWRSPRCGQRSGIVNAVAMPLPPSRRSSTYSCRHPFRRPRSARCPSRGRARDQPGRRVGLPAIRRGRTWSFVGVVHWCLPPGARIDQRGRRCTGERAEDGAGRRGIAAESRRPHLPATRRSELPFETFARHNVGVEAALEQFREQAARESGSTRDGRDVLTFLRFRQDEQTRQWHAAPLHPGLVHGKRSLGRARVQGFTT